MHVFMMSSVLSTSMDAIDLAIRLSAAYVFLLCICSHRCARHLDSADFLQVKVLDAPWQGFVGVGGVGFAGCKNYLKTSCPLENALDATLLADHATWKEFLMHALQSSCILEDALDATLLIRHATWKTVRHGGVGKGVQCTNVPTDFMSFGRPSGAH